MNSGFISFFRPFFIASSPTGERQSVGGFWIFAVLSAFNSLSTSSLESLLGFVLGFIPARLQISTAFPLPTLESSVVKKPVMFLESVCFIRRIRIPSSRPCGCGCIALASTGRESIALGYSNCLPS